MRSVNSARERLNPVVLMLATLLAMTSRFRSCALMPVAAIASALMLLPRYLKRRLRNKSDRHVRDVLPGGDDLVADREHGLQRPLRLHHGLDDLHRRRRALNAFDRRRFARLERADGAADDVPERRLEREAARLRGARLGAAQTGACR